MEFRSDTKEVSFNGEGPNTRSPDGRYASDSWLENLVLSTGLVKTKSGAKTVLVAIVLACLATIIFMNSDRKNIADSYGNYDTFVKENPEIFSR